MNQSLTGSGSHGGQKRRSPWKNVHIRYQFNAYEMNETKLMKNLSWITQTNDILSRITTYDDDNDNDDNDERRQNNKMGSCKEDDSIGERKLRKALPEMTRTLKNSTVYGQCLGDMVECYRRNNRDYTPKQKSEIGHFFNTASNIPDTIGSMTEGSILRSVEFPSRRQGGSLTGSRHTQIGNRPEAKLFPTRDNLLKYTAIYPGLISVWLMWSHTNP